MYDRVKRRQDDEREDGSGNEATDHRRSDSLHDLTSGLMANHNRHEADYGGENGHEQRPDAVDRALLQRRVELESRREPPFSLVTLKGFLEVDVHYDSGLSGQSRNSNNAYSYGNREIEIQHEYEPNCANYGKWKWDHQQNGISDAPKMEEEQKEDDGQRDGY